MQTQNYSKLLDRFQKLNKALLPKVASPIGNYRDSTYERTRAYKVLTHAEIEYYFEQTVLAIANTAFTKWTTSNKSSKTITALVAYNQVMPCPLPDSKGGNCSSHTLEERVSKSYQSFCALVNSKNHGIKETNILNLVLPVGFIETDLSDDLLLALNNYGTTRGLIAHSTRATQRLSPKDVKDEGDNLVYLIRPLDVLFYNCLDDLNRL